MKVEETSYGYKVMFGGGLLVRDAAGALLSEIKSVIRPGSAFALMVDMRESRAFPAEAQETLKLAILYLRDAGMERNACILSSTIATLQARRLGRETGVDETSRYIDASAEPDWERIALDWLLRAIDPQPD
jgi:hypothetical protein